VTPAISLKGIGKKYRIASSKSLHLREVFSFGKKRHTQDFWALQDVDLEVEPGTTLGILGRNGAGKSTMLQIISGVLQPTTGTVEVNGRLTAIFGLGSGFNPEFTGRENAMMNGLILGMDRYEMLDRFGEIEAFADIGDFMDRPVKTYSSGMKSRLGFAVAVNVDPDILVIDEALSAGDAAFKKKALQRMYDLRDSGTTVLFVSHSMGMINRFCTDAVLLNRGQMIARGAPDEVLGEYRSVLEKSQNKKVARNAEREQQLDYAITHEDEDDMPDPPNGTKRPRPGTGGAEILGMELLDENRGPAVRLSPGSTLTARVRARYTRAVEESSLGVVLRDRSEMVLFATSTGMEGAELGAKAQGEVVTVDFTFGAPPSPGVYGVEATVSGDGLLGRIEEAVIFEVVNGEHQGRDPVHLPTRVEVHTRDREEQGQAT
jgi:ABC-type polysaccharide/polyol phosphate transport system ATPase subunit